jgi:hypothetical protein
VGSGIVSYERNDLLILEFWVVLGIWDRPILGRVSARLRQ